MLALLCIGALTIWHGSGRRIGELSIVEAARAAFLAAINTIGGAAGLLQASGRQFSTEATAQIRRRAILIGCLLAAPPFAIVMTLLASSDAVFGRMLDRFVSTISAGGFGHLLVAALLAWMTAGWLRAALGDAVGASLFTVRSPGLPFPTVAVALYALIALLLLFVATQVRVLFGGAEFLRVTEGLTVANYAREGFFQLVLAAGVVLGALVMAEWLLSVEDAIGRRHYRIAGRILLFLVATLLVSAAVRIWLFVGQFGLSIDRTLASAAIFWVLAALLACVATTLRGRPAHFAPLTLYCTIGWVVVLSLINPEARVVDVNISRAVRGLPFDAKYHAGLSADAVPALLRGAHRLSPVDCESLVVAMRDAGRQRFEREGAGTTGAAGVCPARGWLSDWRRVDLALNRSRELRILPASRRR